MRSWFSRAPKARPIDITDVLRARDAYARLDDETLKRAARQAVTIDDVFGATAVIASQVLGLHMFDEQIEGALALARGSVAEMQTGEGKTLAAVPAIAWLARHGGGVHVLSVNDYLARRDAAWMHDIYDWLGLSVSAIGQQSTADERRAGYLTDITYTTANEVGFDYLRDGLALEAGSRVLRPFAAAVIDEADSILIDEARIPLVIAGGAARAPQLAVLAHRAVRELIPHHHFTIDTAARNVRLTDAGVARIERVLGCGNLYDTDQLPAHTAVQDALHAHVLLRRDVDYVVQNSTVLSVDEFKGRIVAERRWPAGLQTALECKEGVLQRTQGRVLGSITIEHLIALYPRVCGMTGTAATQADELRNVYGLDVAIIPTHRPIVRIDHPDRVFPTKVEKELAVYADIRRLHGTGQPVLVGTASVEESERMSRALRDIPHAVLNARNEEEEAGIIARAGERGALTVSTNMAGRGVDIRLGPGVAALGGLHVIGTNRHASWRIDHQLRGRSGRQGDPGSSQFFVSDEDAIMVAQEAKQEGISPDQAQRMAEGQNLDVRLFMRKYETVVEGQRLAIRERRESVLEGATPTPSETARRITLMTIDDLWADYLAAISELRAGTIWNSLGAKEPWGTYLAEVHAMFTQLQSTIDEEVDARLEQAGDLPVDAYQRGATWTYLTTDEPFGTMTERIMKGLVRRFRQGRQARSRT